MSRSLRSIIVDYRGTEADSVSLSMGHYLFESEAVPVRTELPGILDERISIGGHHVCMTCLNLGCAHAVILGKPVTPSVIQQLGHAIGLHPLFPRGTHVECVEVKHHTTLMLEAWTQCDGYTLASCNAACAAAIACHRLGMVSPRVTVQMPGGRVNVVVDHEQQTVCLRASAKQVVQGELNMPQLVNCH
ncbi:hypothetical protein QQM79_11925 [Marinobacteraceae bacterium S3BR75-40.1]